jgi:hypothetical protein
MDAWYAHSLLKHARQSEGHFLWKLLTQDRHFEAVSKVNVHYIAGMALKHNVGRMTIAKAEDVADHAHGGKTACVVIALINPNLAVGRLEA